MRDLHVAIIMDGNGRWARARGLPRVAGHREGANAVRRVVEASSELGISTLTLYAFSADNWKRPRSEVATLMALFERFLRSEHGRCVEHGVRLNVIGRRDRLDARIVRAVRDAEAATARCRRLHLRLAVDYSARHAIARAARSARRAALASHDRFLKHLNRTVHSPADVPPVDLLIRTGGEKRLSDFLLWELAYAELLFTDRPWPDFDGRDLARAVAEFLHRERRYGGLNQEPASRRISSRSVAVS